MTMIPPTKHNLWRARKDTTLPFRIRAGIINAYRRKAIRDAREQEDPTQRSRKEKEVSAFVEAPEEKREGFSKTDKIFRSRKRRKNRQPKRIILPTIGANHGSKHNFVRVRALRLVLRQTSAGKNRRRNRRKDHFVSRSLVIHKRGNRFNGGFEWPTSR